MAKVIAKVRGYFGGMIREAGEMFHVPDDQKPPKWTRPHAFSGKGDHDGDGKTGGSKPAEKSAETSKPAADPAGPVVVPADWRNKKSAERKALAVSITGEKVANVAEADRIIEAFVESSKPAPFDDAPEPETVKGNGVVEAIGGVQPDWIAPGSDI